MKTLVGFFIITILLTSYTTPKDSTKILWSKDYQLQWDDFRGLSKQSTGVDASTECMIDFHKVDNKYGVFCYFIKNKSWRIKKKETDYLLKHEQYHFNIAEVYARKFRKEIIESKLISNPKELEKADKENFNELMKTQNSYDKETNHSRIAEEQEKWEKDIDKQLEALNDFSNPFVE